MVLYECSHEVLKLLGLILSLIANSLGRTGGGSVIGI